MVNDSGIKHLFVTGANGYVGAMLTQFAVADGYEVHALSRTEESDHKLKNLGAVPVRGDLGSVDVIRAESALADAIILLASAYTMHTKSYDDIWPIDTGCMDAVADAVEGTNKPVLMTMGTLAVEPDPHGEETDETAPRTRDPINTREVSEEHAFILAKERGINIMIIRLAPYVYGRGGSGVKLFMGMGAQSGNLPVIDGGTNRITTVHVDDAARLYLRAMRHGRKGEIYNATSETNVTAQQLMNAMANILGVPVKPITYEEAVKLLGEFFAKFVSRENRATSAKAQREFGWQPREVGILQDITDGSYLEVAASLKGSSSA